MNIIAYVIVMVTLVQLTPEMPRDGILASQLSLKKTGNKFLLHNTDVKFEDMGI